MADAAHVFGSDLSLSPTGDISLADGTALGQQRVLRRLLTAPGAYIWHVDYGAGLGRFVGTTASALRIAAVARTQMFREAAVAQTPPPTIDVNAQPTGVTSLTIQYVDATTDETAVLPVNLPGQSVPVPN